MICCNTKLSFQPDQLNFPRIDLSTITYKFHDFLKHYRIDYPTLTLKKFKRNGPDYLVKYLTEFDMPLVCGGKYQILL